MARLKSWSFWPSYLSYLESLTGSIEVTKEKRKEKIALLFKCRFQGGKIEEYFIFNVIHHFLYVLLYQLN